MEDEPLRRVCAVCARVLDLSQADGWVHTQQDGGLEADHPPVPVTDADVKVRPRCDFCSAEPVVSFIVSEPLRMVGVTPDDEQVPLRQSDATWACCVVCDRLIRKNRWPRVTERAVRLLSMAQTDGCIEPEVAQALRDLHETVAKHMVGAPVRYQQ